MDRRRFIHSGISVAAAGSIAMESAGAAEPPAIATLPGSYASFAEWVAAAQAGSMQYLRESGIADTRRFIRYLAVWASVMPPPVKAEWAPIKGANRRLEMATLAAGRPFVVSAFRMEAGCVLPAHCHPDGGGITTCLEGSLTMQHFELCEGSAPFTETGAAAQVRQVQVARLLKDEATQFTPTESNLHQLRAGQQGAMGVDIAVQWQGAGIFSFLKLHDDLPVSIFGDESRDGIWTGMNIADGYVG